MLSLLAEELRRNVIEATRACFLDRLKPERVRIDVVRTTRLNRPRPRASTTLGPGCVYHVYLHL